MADYIDIDELGKHMCDTEQPDENFADYVERVLDCAEDLPVIDIVFCKDCKRWNRGYFQDYMCHSDVITGPNDFCSYGERKYYEEG